MIREQIFPFRETTTESEDSFPTQMHVHVQSDFSITHKSGTVSQESHTDTTDDPIQSTNIILVPVDISTIEAVEVEHAVPDTSTELPTEIESTYTETEPEITTIPDPNMMEPTDTQGSRKTTRTSKLLV